MSHRVKRAFCSAVGILVVASFSASAQGKERARFQEGEVIVKFVHGTKSGAMSAAAASAHSGAVVAKTMAAVGRPRVALVRFPKDVSVEQMVAAFRGQRGVEYAEPNYLAYIPEIGMAPSQNAPDKNAVRAKDGRATLNPRDAVNPGRAAMIDRAKANLFNNPNDPYAFQGGWSWIGADVIWPDTVANPMIAVIDSGVDHMHPDLAGRVVKGGDWVNNDNDPMDDNGHGTHVAGIAGASVNNGQGMAGVSKSQIYAVKVLGAQGSGTFFDIASGIVQAANNPTVKILNLSLGGPCGSVTLTGAMELAATKGKLIVVAMGNSNADITAHTTCPASYADPAFNPLTGPVTMGVGASGAQNHFGTCPGPNCQPYTDYSCKASYSNFADWMTIIAPGTEIFATTPNNRPFWMNLYQGVPGSYAYLNGTSMASPMVAGSAARTFSAMPAGTTAAQVKTRLTTSGTPDIVWGQGSFIDTDGDGVTDTECWPTAAGFNPNTNGALVPAAMRRAEVGGRAVDANGALGLTGAKITPYSGTAPKGVPGTVDNFWGSYRIVNLPMNNTTPYDFAVNKAGFTAANQKFTRYDIPDCGGGTGTINCVYNFNEQVSVGANTTTRYNLVTDWSWEGRELDQYVYGPSANGTANCSVGYSGSCGVGELNVAPFMKWLHDGGPFAGSGPTEFVQIQTPLAAQGAGTPYEIFATDYCLNTPGEACGSSMYDYNGTFRLWKGGVILATVRAFAADVATHNCTLIGGAVPCSAWYVGDLSSAGVFTSRNIFGKLATVGSDPDGVLPYAWRPTENTLGGSRRRGLPAPPVGTRARKLPN